ncbi:MAG: DUF1700 domain-containing protein [Clostridia bacterium]|nr:DUF1700 domain-containing protein [Clostridia bacterium]
MNKEQYLSKLKKMLPTDESNEIINDFEEHFATGMAEGKTEQEIIESLGDPVDIAKEYGYDESKDGKMSVGSRIVGLIGLLFFDILIGVSIILTLFSIWLALWTVVLGLVVSGIAAILGMFFIALPWYILLFGGISVLALAVLMGIGMIYLTIYSFKGLVWFANLHIKMVTGE